MKRQAPDEIVHAPDETETIDLTSLLAEDFLSPEHDRLPDVSSSLLGKLFEALPLPALLLERSGRITFANTACARIHKDYRSILQKPFSRLFAQEKFKARAVSLLEEVFNTRRPHTGEAVVAIRGSRIWARMSFRSIRIGKDRVALVLIEDLTHEKAELSKERKHSDELRQEILRRKAVEKALRESEQKKESAMKGADVSLWDWNVSTGVLVCDDRFSEILGYTPGDIQARGASWLELVHAEDLPRFRQSIRDHFAGLSSFLDVELRGRCKSGDWKWLLTRGRVVERDGTGQPVRLLGTILDITEHKQNQERVRGLTRALVEAQERERQRIALDLHDDVAQRLSAFRMLLEPVREELALSSPKMEQQVVKFSGLVRDLVEHVCTLSSALRPAMLDRWGLEAALDQYCTDFSAMNKIEVDFRPIDMEGVRLDFEKEINLFRVAQEALTNVKKHAQARRVSIELQVRQSRITLSIEDDGKGFDVHRESAGELGREKMGLSGMEQRATCLAASSPSSQIPRAVESSSRSR